jgi:hypothetical protein
LRLQLRRSLAAAVVTVAAGVAGAFVLMLIGASSVRADDHVTVRGAYFKEASTRVVQPVVEIAKDVPGGIDVTAHYLLDAITSASAVSGGTGGDSIFTEMRNEVALVVGKTFDRTRIGLGYRYSAESDYWSHGGSLSLSQRFWGDTATVSAFAAASFDSIAVRTRTINCPRAEGSNDPGCKLNTYTGGISYAQVISPTLLAQVSYDISYLDGFQANPYRQVNGFGYEVLPFQRTRQSVTPRVAYYLPRTRTGFQLHYRYYHDSWSIDAHMIEGRVYQALSRDLEIRLSYRHYFQTPSYFWCDVMARSDCLGSDPKSYTSDPKLTPVRTEMPEVKLVWDAVALQGVPLLGWFARGTFELSYARYIQNTSFGDANVLQVGYTMPY